METRTDLFSDDVWSYPERLSASLYLYVSSYFAVDANKIATQLRTYVRLNYPPIQSIHEYTFRRWKNRLKTFVCLARSFFQPRSKDIHQKATEEPAKKWDA